MSKQIVDFRPADVTEWMHSAACDGTTDQMFPHDSDAVGIEIAKEVCGPCPVRSECLKSALDRSEPYGVWGGLTSDERQELKRRVNRKATRKGFSVAQAAAELDRLTIVDIPLRDCAPVAHNCKTWPHNPPHCGCPA